MGIHMVVLPYNIQMLKIEKQIPKSEFYGQMQQNLLYSTENLSFQMPKSPFSDKFIEKSEEEDAGSETFSYSEESCLEVQNSAVSFEDNLMQENLACLKYSILKFLDWNLEFLNLTKGFIGFEFQWNDQEEKVEEYILRGKSLIPKDQMNHLLNFLHKDRQLHETLQWIYDHVSPRLGDQLILAAHRILQAYLPIRHLSLSIDEIHIISALPFNIINILNTPSFYILKMAPVRSDTGFFFKDNQQLFVFMQYFIESILLILEKYFCNPQYAKIKSKPFLQEKPVNKSIPLRKKKKITKQR